MEQGSTNYISKLLPPGDETLLRACSDNDWAGCQTTRKSTTGTGVQLAGAMILTSSKTQQRVAQSSAEAELYAIYWYNGQGRQQQQQQQVLGYTAWDYKANKSCGHRALRRRKAGMDDNPADLMTKSLEPA
eukprot:1355043-Amphidinium_carterae.7